MKGIVFASFGTSSKTARENHIDPIAKRFESAYPSARVVQAYTSGMIRHILEKQGLHIPNVAAALDALAEAGISEVAIQPGHLLPGTEYDKLCLAAESRRNLFKSLAIGRPLLSGSADLTHLAEILSARFPQEVNTATVLMGHGTPHFANIAYAALNYHFGALGRQDIIVGALESYPAIQDLLPLLAQQPCKNLVLAPLMQVAGDHAQNDMAGPEKDSWASRLQQAGYTVECKLWGLGGYAEVQDMYLAHLQAILPHQ